MLRAAWQKLSEAAAHNRSLLMSHSKNRELRSQPAASIALVGPAGLCRFGFLFRDKALRPKKEPDSY